MEAENKMPETKTPETIVAPPPKIEPAEEKNPINLTYLDEIVYW